jgi:ribosomal protein S3
MGQKVNPIIFRLGILKNEWRSKYFEKNLEEFSLYSFQNIQIKRYLDQFLNESGLILHDYKMYFNETSLHLYVSYFVTSKIILNISKVKRKKFETKTVCNSSKISIFLKNKLQIYKRYEKFLLINKFRYQTIIDKNSFIERILESLTVFLNRRLNILIIFQQVRKGLSLNFNNLNYLDKKILKNKFLFFRRYLREPFFKDMFHLLILSVKLKSSASLLSNFISNRLVKMKKHTQFFFLLKHILIILQKTKISKMRGVKIKIKGRFNGKSKASSKFIIVGQVPVQTLVTKIDYSESISYTFNGTFGVKVWIVYKN